MTRPTPSFGELVSEAAAYFWEEFLEFTGINANNYGRLLALDYYTKPNDFLVDRHYVLGFSRRNYRIAKIMNRIVRFPYQCAYDVTYSANNWSDFLMIHDFRTMVTDGADCGSAALEPKDLSPMIKHGKLYPHTWFRENLRGHVRINVEVINTDISNQRASMIAQQIRIRYNFSNSEDAIQFKLTA